MINEVDLSQVLLADTDANKVADPVIPDRQHGPRYPIPLLSSVGLYA